MADILDHPERAEAVRAALPALADMAMSPASRERIMEILGRRFAVFPQPERTDGEWAAWWADYIDTLGDLPAPSIDAAMVAYVAQPDSEFFPKPGKIAALAKSAVTDEARAYSNARHVASLGQAPAVLGIRHTPSEAELKAAEERVARDREAVRKMAADLGSVLKAPDEKRVKVRPNHGRVDETGITPAMRAIIASRQSPQAAE